MPAAVCTIIVVMGLSACVGNRVSPSRAGGATLDEARGPNENAKLYTDLIRQLIAQDRLYAALAHLQAREQEFGVTDELRLLRADILRKMDDTAGAQTLYEQLLKTSYAAEANHGLGLIYARDDIGRGTEYLRRAVKQAPTNAQMRNDLGYALLRQGHTGEARVQLTTAYQLDQNNELNRNNYILLLLVEGETRQANQVAASSQVPAGVMDELRAEAEHVRQPVAAGAENASTQLLATPPARTEADDKPQAVSQPALIGGGGG